MEKKMNWKRVILPGILFLLAFSLYFGYSIWENGNPFDFINGSNPNNPKGGGAQTVAVFQEESDENSYSSVGIFISEFHKKYNDTLGWGRIDTVDWDEQRKITSEIIAVISTVETDNSALQADLDAIANYSRTIEEGIKDKKILLQLHRYFHDLDVEFNQYNDTNDYFNVTKYKG